MTNSPDRPLTRTRLAFADLRAAWEEHAAEFIAWARKPDHDSYWLFHRDQSLELLPPPGRRTLDLGCGEGRLSRDLKARGHSMIALDASPTMVAAAREADPDLEVVLADAAVLPFEDEAFDLVVAFMSLQDMDDLDGAILKRRAFSSPAGLCVSPSFTRWRPQGTSRGMRRPALSSSRAPTSRPFATAIPSSGTASR